jgi:hypothetical protein
MTRNPQRFRVEYGKVADCWKSIQRHSGHPLALHGTRLTGVGKHILQIVRIELLTFYGPAVMKLRVASACWLAVQ